MTVFTTMGFWAASALVCLVIAFLGGWHHWHLDERHRELKVHNDSQVKYFGMIVNLFSCIIWIVFAAVCCGMMVYTDIKTRGL
ncbi:hypothetical protein D9M71_344510 [compost metagenome]